MRGTSWIVVAIVIVVGSAVGITAGTFLATLQSFNGIVKIGNPFAGPFGSERYVRILMMGEDNTGGSRKGEHGLSDTLVVMAVDTNTKEVRAISIPRDTMVEIPGYGTCKINAANVHGGPLLAKQVVQDLIGADIPYYVATTTTGLRGMVDMLGGVYIKIDKDMRYTDRHQGLYINLKAGPDKQLLNGKDAEGFVRFRHDAVGDSGFRMVDGKKVAAGRTVRQQLFVRALVNRLLSLPTKRQRADFLRQAYEKQYIVSNLSLTDWDGLADFMKDINPEKMVMDVLPGAPGNIHGVSYWLLDQPEVTRVVAQNLLFQSNPAEVPPNVEVLNGSGITGAAQKVAEKLKEAGFAVARTSNAPRADYTECCIITRKGKTEPIRQIAQLLECTDIREETPGPGKPDVTVIVGRRFSAQL